MGASGCFNWRWQSEALYGKRVAVANLFQSGDSFGKVVVALARKMAVAVGDVDMADVAPCCDDVLANAVFLRVHMKRVDMDLQQGGIQTLNELDALADSVENVAFVAIYCL